jgi:hypothetical protein
MNHMSFYSVPAYGHFCILCRQAGEDSCLGMYSDDRIQAPGWVIGGHFGPSLQFDDF